MSGGRRTSSEEKRWGDTTSKRGEVSRVFVGNIDSFKTTVTDLRMYILTTILNHKFIYD